LETPLQWNPGNHPHALQTLAATPFEAPYSPKIALVGDSIVTATLRRSKPLAFPAPHAYR
jgi:hypothetical protein